MIVKHVACSPFVNQSEKKSVEAIKVRLTNQSGKDLWVLLSNYYHSSNAQYMSDEIDLVVIGPPGVFIVEIKHWSGTDLKRNYSDIAEAEADKLMAKAKRVAGRLRRACRFHIGFVTGKLLLTKSENDKFKDGLSRTSVRGVELFGLKEWADMLEIQLAPRLTNEQVKAVWQALQPASAEINNNKLRAFETFFDLEEVSGPLDPFRRIYHARRKQHRDRVVLHLYDLTALDDKDALHVAERESKMLQAFQKSPWLPSILDSFQPAKSYPGELYFFSYFDSEAPTLEEIAEDKDWKLEDRLFSAQQCIRALTTLHTGMGGEQKTALHRNLTPSSIRIRSNGEPLLTQFNAAKLTGSTTIAGAVHLDLGTSASFFAPEVRSGGLESCTPASDIYSLCATLRRIFEPLNSSQRAKQVLSILDSGLAEDPALRPGLDQLLESFEQIKAGKAHKDRSELPPAEYWDETTTGIELNGNAYQILTKLGQGGFGITFKVMEINPETNEEISGPYVAKVINNEAAGKDAAQSYKRVRAQTGTDHLAGILEVINEWQPNRITALLKWVDGSSLDDLTGVLPIHFDYLKESAYEDMLLGWMKDLCKGLTSLHYNGLVHGDISPKNIIINRYQVTITDFDLSGKAGEKVMGGTEPFCSPEISKSLHSTNNSASHLRHYSDDLYALGATIFKVLFVRPPFDYSEGDQATPITDKSRGLVWNDADRAAWPRIAQFLDRATSPEPSRRFASAMEALEFIDALNNNSGQGQLTANEYSSDQEGFQILTENQVSWLSQLLQSYPGSTKGNTETRGLDSAFARQTYVETPLDELIAEEIHNRSVSLVILCGNAGDGKTAFLQNLAHRLGLSVGTSANRLWDETLADGLKIKANLDGSASYQGKSARELLDSFFEPFAKESFPRNIAHLIAINDGPLLSWLNETGDNFITKQIGLALSSESLTALDPRIRFINLNARSLVGGIRDGSDQIHTGFLDELLSKMLGDDQDDEWRPCLSCIANAKCSAWNSVKILRDSQAGPLLKKRLTRTLLAVHQRGEIHITARNLRSALVYIFFGTHDCAELHENPDLPGAKDTYYNRAFDAASLNRQGELLEELHRLDPAMESHPRIDRNLLNEAMNSESEQAGESPTTDLASLRRRAWFEWPDEKIIKVADNLSSLTLARGRYLDDFLKVAIGSDEDRHRICSDLCAGLARLEDLPDEARTRPGVIPLKITPRTPTETAFWVGKSRDRFSLRPLLPQTAEGIETLHTHIALTYHYERGSIEQLLINAELFHLLMELKDGYQISDAQSDDIFANLSIFKQRIAQEADRLIYAWSPQDECIFKIQVEPVDGIQKLAIREERFEVNQ